MIYHNVRSYNPDTATTRVFQRPAGRRAAGDETIEIARLLAGDYGTTQGGARRRNPTTSQIYALHNQKHE